jgi:hypothetical protein
MVHKNKPNNVIFLVSLWIVLCQMVFEFCEKVLIILLCNQVWYDQDIIWNFDILHQMGDFNMCMTSSVTIHKELVNGLTIFIFCNEIIASLQNW